MSETELRAGSLVLYKNRPARIQRVAGKVMIELEEGETVRVRPKDVTLLHPGPLESLQELQPRTGEVLIAREILVGHIVPLADLAELIYGEFTPATAWAAWQLVDDGLYFEGSPQEVLARPPEAVAEERAAREAKAAEQQAWRAFLERAQSGQFLPEDEVYLRDVEELAYGRQDRSRVLHELKHKETPENAHALLLELGYWDHSVDPYPTRLELATSPPQAPLPSLPQEERLDLTHLAAFAIDDEGNQDPDDALSLDGNRLWVHVADVAALVPPNSVADGIAHARGANLYLPEETVPMLPPEATQQLGLGLTEISPALSFGMDFNSAHEVTNVEVVPSWVRVTRLTYAEVDERLAEEPFRDMLRLARSHSARRRENGALDLDLPEVKIWVEGDKIHIQPLSNWQSRDLVTEAMLMAGKAAGRLAWEREIPFPYSSQDPPSVEVEQSPTTLSEMYAVRKTLTRSQMTTAPAAHAGLGLVTYSQVTSPLRRYLDLVAHQQLRAHLQGYPLLTAQEVIERVGAAQAAMDNVRHAERLARRHWTLAYLLTHPDWRGEGVLVEMRRAQGTLLIAELDLDARVHLREQLPLDSIVPLKLRGVDLPELEAYFRVDPSMPVKTP